MDITIIKSETEIKINVTNLEKGNPYKIYLHDLTNITKVTGASYQTAGEGTIIIPEALEETLTIVCSLS